MWLVTPNCTQNHGMLLSEKASEKVKTDLCGNFALVNTDSSKRFSNLEITFNLIRLSAVLRSPISP